MMKIEEPENVKCYAIVSDNLVVNIIMWDGLSEYETNGNLVNISDIIPGPGIGWNYVGGKFIDNRPKTPIVE